MFTVRHYDQGTGHVEDVSAKPELAQAEVVLDNLVHDDPGTDAVYYIVEEEEEEEGETDARE